MTRLFSMLVFLCLACQADELDDLLKKAREQKGMEPKQEKTTPEKPSIQSEEKRSSPTIQKQTFSPGKSVLLEISDLKDYLGKSLADHWIYGRFTILNGGVQEKKPIGAVPAGSITGGTIASLLSKDLYKPTIFTIGWLCEDSVMPKTPQNTVIDIKKEKPALLVVVKKQSGYLTVALNMNYPPEIVK